MADVLTHGERDALERAREQVQRGHPVDGFDVAVLVNAVDALATRLEAKPPPTTSYKACGSCGTRLLILRGLPPLNYGEDPAGKVAVTIADPRTGRFLARTEEAGPLEHRHAVHKCEEASGD